MPQLILSETICKVNAVYIEYHWFVERPWFFEWARTASSSLKASAEAPHCGSKLINLDDETYATDAQPWPTVNVCGQRKRYGKNTQWTNQAVSYEP